MSQTTDNDSLDELIRALCSDYIDMELVQYYQSKFVETAVDSIYEMALICLDQYVENMGSKEKEKDGSKEKEKMESKEKEKDGSKEKEKDGSKEKEKDGSKEHLESLSKEHLENSLQEVLESRGIPLRELPYCLGKGLKQDSEIVTEKLRWLDFVDNNHFEQRTPEWYEMRSGLLTATAISSLFGSQAKRNEVIYEKCGVSSNSRPLSVYDSRHWGVKYEPITRSIYELLFKTRVKEYGCIRHPTVAFIGASPDGINVDAGSRKYGRLIEIKNVVSREITGEPLDDYWIQMQIQMEVCDLDLCDFVETKISEFVTEEAYYAYREQYNYSGVLLHFVGLLDPLVNHYEYLPVKECFSYRSAKWLEGWAQKKQQELRHQYRLVKPLYWYLEEFSCVVVERNRAWFEAALPIIADVWGTILKEREDGSWEKRAPCRRRRHEADVKTILLSSY